MQQTIQNILSFALLISMRKRITIANLFKFDGRHRVFTIQKKRKDIEQQMKSVTNVI